MATERIELRLNPTKALEGEDEMAKVWGAHASPALNPEVYEKGVAGKWHEQSALSTPVSGHQRQALRTKRLHSGNLRRSQQGAVKPSQGATTGRENRQGGCG